MLNRPGRPNELCGMYTAMQHSRHKHNNVLLAILINPFSLARLGARAVLFHRIRATFVAYHFRLPLSTSGSVLLSMPLYLSSFLYPFLSTSLHSALSGVESGARCTITEGPAQ